MAKLFIGIALALMLATAALGFLAKGNVDKLKSSLTDSKSKMQKQESDLQSARNEAKKSTEERDAATAKAKEADDALQAKTTELASINTQLTEAKNNVEAKTAEVAELTKKVAMGSGNPVTPAGPDPQIAVLTEQLQKSQAELAEAKAVLDQTVVKGKDNETKVAELEKEKRDREKGVTRRGLTGRILAVNAGWNFVVLSVGDKQGVMVNSPLLVVRGNTPVARLRITSVEPSTSIADVIPGSVARGVTVQPGDSVIFEGTRDEAYKPEADSEPAATPPLPAR